MPLISVTGPPLEVIAPSPSSLKTLVFQMTQAEWFATFATPETVIGGRAGVITVVESFTVRYVRNGVAWAASGTVTLRYATGSVLINTIAALALNQVQPAGVDWFNHAQLATITNSQTLPATLAGSAIQLTASNNSPGASITTFTVGIAYYEL